MNVNTTTNRMGLSLSMRRGRLLVYYTTIKAMGNPEHIRFLFNARDRKIAIQCCEPIDRDSFRVPEYREGEKYQFEISSSPFLSVIYKTCRWDPSMTYLSFGRMYSKNRLVEFDLKVAATIAPEQFVDPGV